MKSIVKYIVLSILALSALSLAPDRSLAYEGTGSGLSDSSSYADLTSAIGTWSTQASHYSLDMLGIGEMEYVGTFKYRQNERRWAFEAEPRIGKIDRNSPSYDKLKDGDVIVAIDGMLITTRDAGFRFANLIASKPVELLVRRASRTRTVTVVPRDVPDPKVPIELTFRCTEQSNKENSVTVVPGRPFSNETGRVIEEIKKRQAELRAITDSLGILASSDPEYLDRSPRGWIGFGLSFSGSIRRNDHGKPADWLFFEYPAIKSIQLGSPAAAAGLRVNDVLLEIDGKELTSEKGGERFSRMEPGQVIEWKVRRGDETFTVETIAGERPQRGQSKAEVRTLDADTLQPLKYTGSLGNTEIEVRGGEKVNVNVDKETGEIIIRSGDSVVRLKPKGDR